MAEYRIRPVDGADEDVADALKELHDIAFGDSAPVPHFENGFWWIAYRNKEPVGFCGLRRSTYEPNTGYLKRVGVLPEFRGRGLQRRMIATRERKAKALGWSALYTDTLNGNVASSNSLIRTGFQLFVPNPLWAGEDFLYWRKHYA